MLDMYDFENDVWIYHSFGGNCYNITAYVSKQILFFIFQLAYIITRRQSCDLMSIFQEPSINALKEIEAFLSVHPSKIVTIFIEDYIRAPNGLTKVFTAAGLKNCYFLVLRMLKNGENQPTVVDMVAKK